jgi:RNA polymerase sigma factor (sigma-70 family)
MTATAQLDIVAPEGPPETYLPSGMRKGTSRSDRALLTAASRGDAEAFAAFYRRYRDVVTAFYLRRVRQPEVAADLMMEVFAAALTNLQRDDLELPDQPAGWLFGIAHHKLVDSYRRGYADDRARKALRLEPMYLDDGDIERVNQLGTAGQLPELLAALPRDQRDVVRARILEERSYGEIAEDIGVSEMVVRKRVSRALGALRQAAAGGADD